eukprot:TRINITY_DN10515_c2_g4_i1.p1 TRINITY_DN10515_c2_g4~~TRINITY_DN10515_c2_g4_i1.p1  ORF type:complete len:380 (-),score=111.95 TRINITY_DN10515_c2_g4_i1:126-1202(-)
MDAQACLEILSKAAGQRAKERESQSTGGSLTGARSCSLPVADSEGKNDEQESGEPGALPPPAPAVPPPQREVGGIIGEGQVIDLDSGENETVSKEMTKANLFEEFPALRPLAGEIAAFQQALEMAEESKSKAPSGAGAGYPEVSSGKTAEGSATAAATIAATTATTTTTTATTTATATVASTPAPTEAAPADLVSAIVQLHQERVAVHRDYDAAFNHLIEGKGGGMRVLGNLYPVVIQSVTIRFKALSEAIRDAATALEAAAKTSSQAPDIKEAAALARKLQKHEQERLQVVAALHAEKGRILAAKNQLAGGGQSKAMGTEIAVGEANCGDYKRKLGATALEIEEIVSELRACAADLR